MGHIGTPNQETLIALGKASFDGTAVAQVRGDNLARRIAAVLEERRRIGEIRRQREGSIRCAKPNSPRWGNADAPSGKAPVVW